SRSFCQASLFQEKESCRPKLVVLRVPAAVDSRRRQDKQPVQPESLQTPPVDTATHTRVPKQLPTNDRLALAGRHEATKALDVAAEPDTPRWHLSHLADRSSHVLVDRRQSRDSSKREFG